MEHLGTHAAMVPEPPEQAGEGCPEFQFIDVCFLLPREAKHDLPFPVRSWNALSWPHSGGHEDTRVESDIGATVITATDIAA